MKKSKYREPVCKAYEVRYKEWGWGEAEILKAATRKDAAMRFAEQNRAEFDVDCGPVLLVREQGEKPFSAYQIEVETRYDWAVNNVTCDFDADGNEH